MHAQHVDLAPDERPPFAAAPVTALAALFLIAHLATVAAGAYGFHRDELLYLAMGQHLRLWSMDFPPGIALIAQTLRATVGDSLLAVRAVPALASSLLVVLAALLAREILREFAAFPGVEQGLRVALLDRVPVRAAHQRAHHLAR